MYLPGLNGIRAIAALMVIIEHCDHRLGKFGLSELFPYGRVDTLGVTLFFVLSGYLITTLLLAEKEKTGTISLRKFYTRRILRIWPAYYLTVLVGVALALFVVDDGLKPATSVFPVILFYLFLLPNVPFTNRTSIQIIDPLWSVGVEEQFYLIWPFIVRTFKKLFIAFAAVAVVIIALRSYGRYVAHSTFMFQFLINTRIDCMAIGGMGALWVHNKMPMKRFVFSYPTQIFAWGIFIYTLIFLRDIPLFHLPGVIEHDFYAFVFLTLILNVSKNERTLITLEQGLFQFIGRISYGAYLYHIVILFVLASFMNGVFPDTVLSRVAMMAILIGSTLVISHLSYRYFEMPFLRLKERFMIIRSSNKKEGDN